MGNILQVRLICETPDLEAARTCWPRLCALARELHRRNSILDGGQGLFLPQWDEEAPMPGVRELAQTLQQSFLIFPDSLGTLPGNVLTSLERTTDILGDALGRWQTDEADAALATILDDLTALEAHLAGTALPKASGVATIAVQVVTWNPALLEKTCPILCEALRDRDKEQAPEVPPPPADVARLLDFIRQTPCPPELHARLQGPLARAKACQAALEQAIQARDPRAANRHSNDMDDILEELEEAVSYRPARKGFFRRIFG